MARRSLIGFLILSATFAAFVWYQMSDRPSRNAASPDTIAIRFELAAVNFDPRTVVDIESKKVQTLLHAGLLAVHQDGRIEPRLASSWQQVSPDAIRFTIRDDVRFSDGTQVDAYAVRASLCEALQPTSFWSFALAMIDRVPAVDGKSVECAGITAPSNTIVEIKTKGSTPPHLFDVLDSPAGWIVKAGEQPGEFGRRAGIGPYVVSKVTPGQDIELVARTDRSSVLAPRVKRVIVRFIPDPALAARAFQTGSLDMVRIDTPALYSSLIEVAASGGRSVRGDGELISHPFSRLRTIIVNEPALAKRGLSPEQISVVRTALSQVIDRSKIAASAPGRAQPRIAAFPPMEKTLVDRPKPQPLDLAVTPQIDLVLLVNNDPYSDLIASNLPKRIGNMSLTYRAVDFAAIISAIQKGENELIGLSLDATIDTPNFWLSFWRPGSALLLFGKALPEIVPLSADSQDDLQRAAVIIQERGNWIPLYADEGLIVKKLSVDGLRLTRSGQESLENIGFRM